MKIDNEFSNYSNDYTIQKFEFEKDNNYPSVKGKFPSLKHLNVLHFVIISQP